MVKGTRNQLYNIYNEAQGDTKKVLTVCSAGLLRSATLQNLLIREYGYNVRNCGTNTEYALIPISEALVLWADEIVFVDYENYCYAAADLTRLKVLDKCYYLDIPDEYNFNQSELVEICRKQYNKIVRDVKQPTPRSK